MKRATYQKIELVVKWVATSVALPIAYLGIFFSRSFFTAILVIIGGMLPYILVYNIVVRGWLFKRIED